ncbi:MAG: hypothetical protein AAF658_06645, partial [Myxococcota bacterium]
MGSDRRERPQSVFDRARFINRDSQRGVFRSRSGARWCAFDDDFWRGLVGALEHTTGATSEILRRTGRHFGERLGGHMAAEVETSAGESLEHYEMVAFSRLVDGLWASCGLGGIAVRWETGVSGFLPVLLRHDPLSDMGVIEPSR